MKMTSLGVNMTMRMRTDTLTRKASSNPRKMEILDRACRCGCRCGHMSKRNAGVDAGVDVGVNAGVGAGASAGNELRGVILMMV